MDFDLDKHEERIHETKMMRLMFAMACVITFGASYSCNETQQARNQAHAAAGALAECERVCGGAR